MGTPIRFRRSILDRLLANSLGETGGVTQTYSLEQLRESVARDVEALLNSRVAIELDDVRGFPLIRRSVVCYGIRDFVGLVLSNTEERQQISDSLLHAIGAFEPRLRDVRIEFNKGSGRINSLSFTIRALLLAHPSAEPVAFDAVLQPTLSRFSVAPARFSPPAVAA